MRKSSFGKYDGVLLLLTLIAISSFLVSSLALFVHQEPSSSAEFWVLVGSGILLAAVFATLGTNKLWLLMGNTDLSKRLCIVALIDFIPSAYLVIGFSYAEFRLGFIQPQPGRAFGTNLLVAILTQRLLVLMIFGVMGWLMQFYSRWRITGPIGDSTSRRKFQTSISDMMVLTAFAAGMFGCISYWMGAADAPRSRRGTNLEEILAYVCAASVVEVLAVLLLLVLPVFISYGAPWVRSHFPRSVALWTLFCGLVSAALGLFVGVVESWTTALGIATTVFVGFAVMGLGLFFVLTLVINTGFRIASQRPIVRNDTNVDVSSVPTRRFGWMAAGASAFLILLTGGFYSLYDVPVLLETGSTSKAKLVASMTRLQWAFPDQGRFGNTNNLKWNKQRITFSSVPTQFIFKGDEQELAGLVQRVVPTATSVRLDLELEGTLSRTLLDELSIRKFSYLAFKSEHIESDDFEAFCNVADVEKLYIESASENTFRSIAKIATLKSVFVGTPLEWNTDIADVVNGLPLRHLRIKLVNGELPKVSSLKLVNVLTISSSLITEEAVQQLSQLTLDKIEFENCRIDTLAAQQFSSLKAQAIRWDDAGIPGGSDDVLYELAMAASSKSLEITTPRTGEFEAKFLNRASGSAAEITIDCVGDTNDDELDDDTALAIRNGSSIERLATEIVRNDAGEITEIDLQEVALGRAEFDELEELEHLERLRLGHEDQTVLWFQRVSRLDSLRKLEITGYRLDTTALTSICKLEKLKRLQLPICINAFSFRHPEIIPIPQLKSEHFDLESISNIRQLRQELNDTDLLRTSEYDDDAYTASGYYGGGGYGGGIYDDYAENQFPDFKAISKLKDLEYLFMPGQLLTMESVDEVATLPKLKELHAVLSVVDQELLEKIVQLENLNALSIGTFTIDKKFVETLKRHKNLRTLQVVLFSDFVLASPLKQKQLLRLLQKGLPNCKVHLIFANNLGV